MFDVKYYGSVYAVLTDLRIEFYRYILKYAHQVYFFLHWKIMYIVYFKLVILSTYSLYGYTEYSMFPLNVYFHYVYIGNLQH